MKRLVSGVAVILFGLAGFGQNRNSFFKLVPEVNASDPLWVQLMYQEDPNLKEVIYLFDQYRQENPDVKTIHTQNFKYWIRQVEPFMQPDGHLRVPTPQEEGERLVLLKSRAQMKSGQPGNWVCLGPFETLSNSDDPTHTASWQANVYCFDQSMSHPTILFAGTEAGGLFKSDSKGLRWELITRDVPVVTIQDVKITSDNPNVVYFTSNNRVYKTTDGGINWVEVLNIGSEGIQLLINPMNSQLVFCAAENGLYRTNDGGINWEKLFNEQTWDIQFKPRDFSVVYIVKNNPTLKRAEFYKSMDGGMTFTIRDAGWYSPSDLTKANDLGAKIAVSQEDPTRVYVALIGESKSDDNGWIGLYRSEDSGESWVNPAQPDGGPYSDAHPNPASFNRNGTGFHQGFYDFDLEVSDIDPDLLWLGTISFSKSRDGGATWTRIGSYNAQEDLGWIHPDIQDIDVNGQDIWICSDGGINYSRDELMTHVTRNKDLAGSDYWGFGQGWNEDVMVGGRYHNGNSGYSSSYGQGFTLRLGGAEAATGYVDPMENRKAYFSDINSVLLPKTKSEKIIYFSKLGMYPEEAYTESYSGEIEFHPYYGEHLYLGKGPKLWRSTNGGGFFEAIGHFGASGKVLEIEISRTNPKVIYCVYQPGGNYWDPCVIKRTSDGGKTWKSTTSVPAPDKWRFEITLNPNDENDLWVISVNGANGRKVYRTTDGGTNWQNKSSAVLDGERPLDILCQGGSGGTVYLASATGVFYYSPSLSEWTPFMSGLPVTTRAMEMKPYYSGGKFRLATGGRGIWETLFAVPSQPQALPMTHTDTVFNPLDTVQFESLSILNADGAQWHWSFDPPPQWIEDGLKRNPKLIFGSNGSYDVTLTVVDGQGQTDTRTIPDMVVVTDPAGPEGLAGKALVCTQNGDYVVTDDFGLTTNILTITAWVQPNGIQSDYTGIVMNNGSGAGINFRGGNNTLGYHWPGGSWSWDSKLVVPSDVWSHVAMVADGTRMTLYVNGKEVIHYANLQRIPIQTMDIGSYQGWAGRNFHGDIDEICIWNRALTAEEIREKQHLTQEKSVNDPTFIAYYQFNESGGQVFNRVGPIGASLYGGSKREESTAPVGKGSSYRWGVMESRQFEFIGTGVKLTFPEGAALYPEGDVVVTRIENLPSALPNTHSNSLCYWIINSYGNDHFSALTQLSFSTAQGSPADGVVESPQHARLFTRPPGSSDGVWQSLCGASSISTLETGAFLFNTACGVGAPGQFIIASDDENFQLLKGVISSIETKDYSEYPARVYPNPVKIGDDIHVEFKGKQETLVGQGIHVSIMDEAGRVVYRGHLPDPGSGVLSLPTKGWQAGTYLLHIESDSIISNSWIVVQ